MWNLDVFSVVNNCKKAGFPEENIVVDVIMTTQSKLEHVDTRNFKSWQMIRRYLDISSHYSMMDGLLRAKYGFPKVSFRHVITPQSALPSNWYPMGTGYNLNSSQVDQAVKMGEQEAQKSIAGGQRRTNDLFHYWGLRRLRDERVDFLSLEEFIEQKQNGVFEVDYDVLEDNYLRNIVNGAAFNPIDYDPSLPDMNTLDMEALTEMFLN